MAQFSSPENISDKVQNEIISIAVCDDSLEDISNTVGYIKRFFETTSLRFKYVCFTNPNELIAVMKNRKCKFDILFLDIEIDTSNGIDVAKEINRINKEVVLIFLTNYDSYMQIGYEVKAFRYILKSQLGDYFNCNLIDAVREVCQQRSQCFVYFNKGSQKIVKYGKIIYFESQMRIINIITVKGRDAFYEKLDNIEMQLKHDLRFVRCHKSYLVNTEYLEALSTKHLTLKGNITIPISRGKIDALKRSQIWLLR